MWSCWQLLLCLSSVIMLIEHENKRSATHYIIIDIRLSCLFSPSDSCILYSSRFLPIYLTRTHTQYNQSHWYDTSRPVSTYFICHYLPIEWSPFTLISSLPASQSTFFALQSPTPNRLPFPLSATPSNGSSLKPIRMNGKSFIFHLQQRPHSIDCR